MKLRVDSSSLKRIFVKLSILILTFKKVVANCFSGRLSHVVRDFGIISIWVSKNRIVSWVLLSLNFMLWDPFSTYGRILSGCHFVNWFVSNPMISYR